MQSSLILERSDLPAVRSKAASLVAAAMLAAVTGLSSVAALAAVPQASPEEALAEPIPAFTAGELAAPRATAGIRTAGASRTSAIHRSI